MLSRRQTLAGSAGFLAALATASGNRASASRVEGRVPYGACVNIAPLQDEAEYRAALESYCQQLTPEYGLYWDYLRPTRDQFNFDYGDKVLAFAEANGLMADVPEPVSLGLLTIGSVGILARRRRRNVAN